MIELATTTYAGCNSQHVRDLLAQRDGITLARASVRRILLAVGMRSPRTQRRRMHRRRRARYATSGDAGARSMAVGMPGLGIEAPGCV